MAKEKSTTEVMLTDGENSHYTALLCTAVRAHLYNASVLCCFSSLMMRLVIRGVQQCYVVVVIICFCR